jgi:hypothetical protein
MRIPRDRPAPCRRAPRAARAPSMQVTSDLPFPSPPAPPGGARLSWVHGYTVRALDDIFPALARSAFRARFRLGPADARYLASKGFPAVLDHARDFVAARLAPADPPNDGRQTPWRGHPVFVAQHATATCCRGCLEKWHGIPAGRPLTAEEQAHAVSAIERWLRAQPAPPDIGSDAGSDAGVLDLFGNPDAGR